MDALAASDQQRAAAGIEVALGKGQSFIDPKAGSPQDHDQRPKAAPMRPITGGAHHGDDLLDLRRIGRVAVPLVAGHLADVEARHGSWRPASTSAIKHQFGHDRLLADRGRGHYPRP
jgi:hypothetical protein